MLWWPTRTGLTVREAAERLGLSYRTVYVRVRQGDLPAERVGQQYRIRRADLERLARASRIQPGDLAHLHPQQKEPRRYRR